eukprot:364868-Chlamydomonas_euryale.AAC.7
MQQRLCRWPHGLEVQPALRLAPCCTARSCHAAQSKRLGRPQTTAVWVWTAVWLPAAPTAPPYRCPPRPVRTAVVRCTAPTCTQRPEPSQHYCAWPCTACTARDVSTQNAWLA